MKGPSITIDELELAFGRKPVLRGVSLEARPGESLGLVGPNGAGKTTLVGCLLGLLRPQAGSVLIDGRPPRDPRARRGFGYLPERCGFDRSSRPRELLALHHALAGLPARRRSNEVAEALERCGLAGAGRTRVRKLSKGMLQRLAFAVALLGEPRLLVLDEPFSGLDPAGVAELRALVQQARERGATILLNSHRLDQVDRICDRVALLSEGRVVALESCDGDGGASLEDRVVAAAREGAR